jgi:hypothetical protein
MLIKVQDDGVDIDLLTKERIPYVVVLQAETFSKQQVLVYLLPTLVHDVHHA